MSRRKLQFSRIMKIEWKIFRNFDIICIFIKILYEQVRDENFYVYKIIYIYNFIYTYIKYK